MASLKAWLSAFRLRTLPLAISSILVGSALAHYHGSFNARILTLSLVTAVLLQILSNLANDVGDFEHGTDNNERIGPTRAVQSGMISVIAMKRGMFICGLLAFVSGLALVTSAFGYSLTTVAFIFIGILAIGAAVKYTYGKNAYGYAGLGDLSVFLFFGLIGVVGTFYLHRTAITADAVLFGVSFGLLSTGVLNLNNMRDRENDANMGKRTVPVIIGPAAAKRYQGVLILFPVLLIAGWFTNRILDFDSVHGQTAWWIPTLIVIPLLLLILVLLATMKKTGSELDPFLKRLALSTFLLAALTSIVLTQL
jgi:1,4-dihydroxy-2-naphthoate octaprenyltransferase